MLATDVAEKILRRNLNPDDQRDLVNRSLEQLQTLRNNERIAIVSCDCETTAAGYR